MPCMAKVTLTNISTLGVGVGEEGRHRQRLKFYPQVLHETKKRQRLKFYPQVLHETKKGILEKVGTL